MRKNNGRRRQRGHSRRNISNINKNTVLESYGPVSHLRGNAFQLIEKYSSLASDAASNDDKVLSEAYLQFADHYYRLNKEIETAAEAKNNVKLDSNNVERTNNDVDENIETDTEVKEKKLTKPSRKERSFRAKTEEDKEKSNVMAHDKLPKKFLRNEKLQGNEITGD